ncbi:hypothetical protein PCE1_000261 [Barthelona sp. PCE]
MGKPSREVIQAIEAELKTTIPTVDADGNELSKKQFKRILKAAVKERLKELEQETSQPAQNAPVKKAKIVASTTNISADKYLEFRMEQLKTLSEKYSFPIYPHKFDVDMTVNEYCEKYDADFKDGESNKDISVAITGRVVRIRPSSAYLVFIVIEQLEQEVQIMCNFQNYRLDKEETEEVREERFRGFLSNICRGDIIGFNGFPGRTRRGELSMFAQDITFLAPCLQVLPDPHIGVRDDQIRFRNRPLDFMVNVEKRKIIRQRADVVRFIRNFLDDHDFIEVETPVLTNVAGGGHAKPFVTFHHDLGEELKMRIAPEIYLKKLVVGGFDRVYEMGKQFRNESMDATHNPEFTSCEFYCAYWDYNDLMDFTEKMLGELAIRLCGSYDVPFGGEIISFKPPFKRISFIGRLEEILGYNPLHCDIQLLADKVAELGITCEPARTKYLDKLLGHYVEQHVKEPAFVIDHPALISPLAKEHRDDPDLTERFELIIAGREIANAYTELNSPFIQEERFREQIAAAHDGDDEAHPFDESFIEALTRGLPPTAGWGLGVDRLIMLLTGQETIKEVLCFPAMKRIDDKEEQQE